jgi:type VI secretion system secreted protein VgrG
MSKQSAQIGHLSAPAFATVAVPFKTSCEAWLNGNTTVEKVTPPVPVVDWKQFANRSFAPAPPVLTGEAVSEVVEEDPNPEKEPSRPVASEDQARWPIKLSSPVTCNWTLKAQERDVTGWADTQTYEAVDDKRNPLPGFVGGGPLSYAFKLKYDPKARCVTASVTIHVVPVDLVQAKFPDQSIPYEQNDHRRVLLAGINSPVNGVIMKYREDTNLDLGALKDSVEATLNRHGGLFILDGCSRSTSCGCRVKVKLEVNLSKQIKSIPSGAQLSPVVLLFPKAQRASSGAWGEQVQASRSSGLQYVSALETNVLTHECMHLFGAPDEYWYWGGWIHKQYIKDGKLDFAKGAEFSGKLTWQMLSGTNLMGEGSNASRADVRPYYLEYVRKGFEEMTGKRWKIGFEQDISN